MLNTDELLNNLQKYAEAKHEFDNKRHTPKEKQLMLEARDAFEDSLERFVRQCVKDSQS
jgi:hypothetical protein